MWQPKILVWDLETTDLLADFGTILCAGYKWLGEKKVNIISLLDFPRTFENDATDDSRLVKEFYKVLSEADIWITWYGERFDDRMFQSKLLEYKLPPCPHVQHIDLWKTCKYRFKLSSNRLKTAAAFMDLEEKTPVLGKVWRRARTGHGPSIRYVIEHCVQDVLVLEQAYLRMRPWVKQHPNMGIIQEQTEACPTCGVSGKLHKRGLYRSRTRTYQRFSCQACGAWCRAKALDKELSQLEYV